MSLDGWTWTCLEAAFALQAPHFTWDISEVLLEIVYIKAPDKLSLMPSLVSRGENPRVWLSCPQSVPWPLPGIPGGRREREREPGKEEASRGPGTVEGGVIGILGSEESPAAGQHSRPTPWHQAVHSSATALASGPSGLPATPAFCTLVCMTSNDRSQCHIPPSMSREFPALLNP